MRKKTFVARLNQEWKNIIFNILFGVLSLIGVKIFFENILLTTLLLLIIAIIGLVKWKSRITLILFILGGIAGALAEIITIGGGVWGYKITNFKSILTWLFVLWGNAGAFIYQTAIEIKKLGVKK